MSNLDEGLDRAVADMAHRDDLAREAARLWAAIQDDLELISDELIAALDRLASTYGYR